MSVHRKVSGLSEQDVTVQKLREEVQLRKAETELARSQLRCVLVLVKEAWQGDEMAMRHVSNIAGVQPPLSTHVVTQMQREIEAVQDREELEEPAVGVYNKCYVVDNAPTNEQELQHSRLQATVEYLEAQLQRDRHWRAGMTDQRHESSRNSPCAFSRWDYQSSSPLKKLKQSLPTEPPLIHRAFSDTELATTSTADFIRVLRNTTPDISRNQIPTASVDTKKQAGTTQLKSNSTSTCQARAEPKPAVSPNQAQARAVRFRIPHTEPATLLIAKRRSQREQAQSQPVAKSVSPTKTIAINKKQSYNPWQLPQCYVTECPAVAWARSDKEMKATRLLQRRLGIGPEGMV
ncbi:uncharacterized protein LOC134178070 [Corticium candelabrum]|uniref:uncharacterized protein LOC134178070 n=1 Tax=Corticium candelabrum TaxID=121492 RepID=UPI002E254C42|nr:uncharacterized protein LOC134178070 [Corticium candelabrum]